MSLSSEPSRRTPSPRTVAIIPARGGSKGVPGKNLRTVGGISLVARAVGAALRAERIDTVYVSTDDESIAAEARDAGAEVIGRPVALSGDLASSESALLHALDVLAEGGSDPAVCVFIQCTSPFVDPVDLDRGVARVIDDEADSAFSAVGTYAFLWRDADPAITPGTGTVVGQNHDAGYRPRRQDRRPDFRETGAFYVMNVAGFRAAGHRFFGRTALVEVAELTSMEIDTPVELEIAGALAAIVDPVCVTDQPVDEVLLAVDALVTDFDGVHTADTVYVDEHGHEAVRVSRSDGLGVARLRSAGVPVLILSKERNPVVTARAAKLGVDVLQSVDDKAPALLAWLAGRAIDPQRCAYVGNDVNDLGAMAAVGWGVAVADAHPQVKQAARVVLSRAGGYGAVREICDLVIAARRSTPGAGVADFGGALSGPDSASTKAEQAPAVGAAAARGPLAGQPV